MSQALNKVPPLPETQSDLIALRKTMNARTLNDEVDSIHVVLWEKPEYRKFINAVFDEDATEGLMVLDHSYAAGMIRDYAREHKNPEVMNKSLVVIMKSLNYVLRRYGISRSQRARMVGGVVVPDNGDTTDVATDVT